MKKVLTTLLAVMLAVVCLASVVSAADVSVNLDGKKLDFEQPPVIIEGRTLVPLRAIFEALGASVEWDDATKTVTSVKEDVTIKLAIGSNVLYRNGEGKELDVPAQIVGAGYTMVPARAIAEAYGVTVDWDDATKTVLLTSPVKEDKVEGAIITLANAENGMGAYAFTPGSGQISIVDDPLNASNKVYFVEAKVKDKKSWNYLWYVTEFIPGKTYKITYDVLLAKDANDAYVEKSKTSACFQFAQSDKHDGAVKDHGMKLYDITPNSWVHVELLTEVPSTLLTDKTMKFGIYIDPVAECGVSAYIDNITVMPTEESVAPATPAEPEKVNVDWNTLKGIMFEFDESADPFKLGNCTATFENGVMIAVCENSTDPQLGYYGCSIDTSKYKGIAVRFKAETQIEKANLSAVYFATDIEKNLSESKRVNLPFASCTVDEEGFYNGYIDMSKNQFWTGTVTQLRIDPADSIGTYTYDKILIVEK